MSTVGILSIPCPTCGAPIDGQCETTAVTYEPRPPQPTPRPHHRLPLGHRGDPVVTTLPTAERYEATRVLAPRLTHVANRLREQANRFDRLAELIAAIAPAEDGDTPYADAVAAAVQQLMNEVANLSLGGVIGSAAKVDVYRSQPAEEATR